MCRRRRTWIRRWSSSTHGEWNWQISGRKVCSSSQSTYLPHNFTRYRRWKRQTYSGHDMDPHPSIHHRRYQVCRTVVFDPSSWLTNVPVKKVFERRKGCYFGVNGRQNHTKKWTYRTFHIVGRMGSLCASKLLYLFCIYLYDYRCALIHCHRPDLLDYDKLDKVRHFDYYDKFKYSSWSCRPIGMGTHCSLSTLPPNIWISRYIVPPRISYFGLTPSQATLRSWGSLWCDPSWWT